MRQAIHTVQFILHTARKNHKARMTLLWFLIGLCAIIVYIVQLIRLVMLGHGDIATVFVLVTLVISYVDRMFKQ